VTIATSGLVVGAVTVLAAGCGDDQLTSSTEAVPSMISSTVGSATTSSSRRPATLSTTSSTNEAADPVADILAAAAAHWRSGVRPRVRTLHVVDRLGEANEVGAIQFDDNSPQMTDLQRRAIESALAPRVVMWTHDLESVTGTAMTIPREEAVVMFAEPTIEGGRAEIFVNFWCGMMCGGGVGLGLEQSSADGWKVTREFDGFIA
jgi:hypothetical protein